MSGVAVLIPWAGGDPFREAALAHCVDEWVDLGCSVVLGDSQTAGSAFSRTQGILDARSKTDAEVLIVADSDVFPAGRFNFDWLHTDGWTLPWRLLHRLSKDSSARVLAGEDWRGLPLSTDNEQDSRPYEIQPGGTALALLASTFDACPPDPRFVGWGQEDAAWSLALWKLIGTPRRGDADLVHLWHPPAQRMSRVYGNHANLNLLRRYQRARRRPAELRALIAEGLDAWGYSDAMKNLTRLPATSDRPVRRLTDVRDARAEFLTRLRRLGASPAVVEVIDGRWDQVDTGLLRGLSDKNLRAVIGQLSDPAREGGELGVLPHDDPGPIVTPDPSLDAGAPPAGLAADPDPALAVQPPSAEEEAAAAALVQRAADDWFTDDGENFTIEELKTWVGDSPQRAAVARSAEDRREKPRVGAIEFLDALGAGD